MTVSAGSTHAEIIVAVIRMYHEQEDDDPSFMDFVAEGELSPNTVSRVLHSLEYKGILRIRHGRGHVRNEYSINERVWSSHRMKTQGE